MSSSPLNTPSGHPRRSAALAIAAVVWVLTLIGVTLATVGLDDGSVAATMDITGLTMAQVTMAVVTLVLPAILLLRLDGSGVLHRLHGGIPVRPMPVLWTALFTIAAALASERWLVLPETIDLPGDLEATARALHETALELQAVFLSYDGPWEFILVLVAMALTAAVAEELLFRGALQTLLIRAGLAPVLAILGSAALFAVLHLQIYFLPALFAMGLVLGILFYWSGNLWYAMIAHFLNNGLIVVAHGLHRAGFIGWNPADANAFPAWFAWVGLVSLPVLGFLTYRSMKRIDR